MNKTCVSSAGKFARHVYTQWIMGPDGPARVVHARCLRCNAPKVEPVPWTKRGKVKCPGGNKPGTALRRDPGTHRAMTARCPVCGKRVSVRWSVEREDNVLRTHYTLTEEGSHGDGSE